MSRLGINIDHVATLRNARGEDHPNILEIAKIVKKIKELKKWPKLFVIIVNTFISPIKITFPMVVKLLELFQKISHI